MEIALGAGQYRIKFVLHRNVTVVYWTAYFGGSFRRDLLLFV